MLLPTRKAVEATGLSANTLGKHFDNGLIKGRRMPNGDRLYDIDNFVNEGSRPAVICYARVSSTKQREDLARQVAWFRSQFPEAEIVKDIGSGLNWKRKGLKTLLDRVLRGDKLTIVVAHRDRLCRFGFELIEYLVNARGGEIMVLDRSVDSPESELTADLLAILHVFSCRMHGLRRYANAIKEDPHLPGSGTEREAGSVV